MDITISPQGNSISKELNFKLGKYTIFAGENNAGKTNLMRALRSQLPEEKTIYIPAESIKAEDHLKTGSKDDPMREAFLKLVEVSIEQMPTINYEIIEEFLNKISQTFNTYNVRNITLDLGVKKLSENDLKKIIKDEVSKKILDSVVKDSYGTGNDLTIADVGQGTQRLIIAATLQEVSKARTNEGDEIFLIFEEPEIYLHPKLKRSLYEALLKISENNIRVILTTHDPYFIELGTYQTIQNVFRGNDGATDVGAPPMSAILPSPTYAETNYVIFEVPSTDYLLQLYHMAEENQIDGFKENIIDGVSVYNIRGSLAHRPQENISEDLKKKTIDYLRSILV
ncbi:MAG: AAA family ATPase [Minisyncoccia bacterium]